MFIKGGLALWRALHGDNHRTPRNFISCFSVLHHDAQLSNITSQPPVSFISSSFPLIYPDSPCAPRSGRVFCS